MVEEIGINSKYYPKGYLKPARWVRKLFGLHHGLVPKFLYYEMLLSLFFAGLGPINVLIYIATDFSPTIFGILVMLHMGLSLLEVLFSLIMYSLYKK